MFCESCGAKLNDDSLFCGKCGTNITSSQSEEIRNTNGLKGFSLKINDPKFASYKKQSVAWPFIFSGILAVIAIVGFPIYGNSSGEIDWPDSLFYGIGIGSMFIIIALLQTLKRGFDKTWDGVVEFKDSYTKKERNRNGRTYYHTYYIIRVKKDFGGTKSHKWRDTPGLYGYYNVGDKVRHHKGFSYYEKYDKSNDTQIMCAACMSFQDMDKEFCSRCKCPLLKG